VTVEHTPLAYSDEPTECACGWTWSPRDAGVVVPPDPDYIRTIERKRAAAWIDHLGVEHALDAAWAEAEAALPEGWHIDRLHRNGPKDWTAYASEAPYLGLEMGAHNTPAAALRALAAKLRERPVSA
jgi:hypothetical protein